MLMDAFLAINHLLNFAAPAFWLAFVLVLISHIFFRKQAKISGWIKPVAINFAVGLAVLLLGLWFFGNDGKMFTYGALVVVSATCQWLSLRSWRE